MIDCQLRTSGVNEPFVLKRVAAVAREEHVPARYRSIAYIDRSIHFDGGGAIAAPLFYGAALEEADPKGGERALVVDNGSGYLPALLEPLVTKMTVITPEEACKGTRGKGADLLMIDGAAEEIPVPLIKRLADGARVVTGMVDDGVTRLAVGRKAGNGVALLPVRDIGIPRIGAFDKPKGWSF